MVLNIFTLQGTYLGVYLFSMFFRCLDSGCSCDGKQTKIIFKRKYNMMYTGADFDIGLRYSEVSFIDLII